MELFLLLPNSLPQVLKIKRKRKFLGKDTGNDAGEPKLLNYKDMRLYKQFKSAIEWSRLLQAYNVNTF